MKIKSNKYLLLMIFAFILTGVMFYWFSKTSYFQVFSSWSKQNLILFFVILLVLKISGIVWPPLPGGLFTLGAIPLIGWFPAYAVDLTGSMIGSSMAFFLGQKYGYSFLKKIFDEETIAKIKRLRIKSDREIEAVVTLRIFTGSLFFEAICYGAGLLNIRYSSFLVGSFVSHMIVGIPSYYLTGSLIGSNNVLFGILGFIIAIPLMLKLKGRYLE